jgi:hypothetical protein
MFRVFSLRCAGLSLSGLALALALFPASVAAQLVLPGAAVPPTSEGATQPRPAPPRIKPAIIDPLIGKPLMQNGFRGRLIIMRGKTGLAAQVIMAGEKISKPNEACGIDPGGNEAIAMKALPSQGAPRYEVLAEGCPFTLAVLDDSVLVSGPAQACLFQSADCRVSPAGLWGPGPALLEPRTADFEKERPRVDRAVRETYRDMISDTRDKAEIRRIAGEQAGFSAEREMMCRNYAREAVHGFCALRFTEYRAVTLQAPNATAPAKPATPNPASAPRTRPAQP